MTSKSKPAATEFITTASSGKRTRHTAPDACALVKRLKAAYDTALEAHVKGVAYNDKPDACTAFAAAWPEQIVWGGGRIVAALIPKRSGEMYVTRFDGIRPKPFGRDEFGDESDLYDHPTRPGREREPVRSFRLVTSRGRLDGVHEGRGLTLEEVVAWEAEYFASDQGDTEPYPAYDVTILCNGLVVAILRNLGDQKGSYQLIRVGGLVASEPVVSVEKGVGTR